MLLISGACVVNEGKAVSKVFKLHRVSVGILTHHIVAAILTGESVPQSKFPPSSDVQDSLQVCRWRGL